jgi:hypothetical protein
VLYKLFFTIAFLAGITSAALSQTTTRGIVVDSLTLRALPGVHVRIKNSDTGTVTNGQGVFTLSTTPADTLVLTLVGYNALELPLFLEESDIFLRLSERIRMLKEITINATRLYENEVSRAPRSVPRKMSAADGFRSPWEYFARGQREKRKVVKLINENDRIRTYIRVINDQEIREEIMEAHELSETDYYGGLAKFNQQSDDVLYSTDINVIVRSLKTFFKMMYP